MDAYQIARTMIDAWPSDVELVRRLLLVMEHVALNTRDQWAKEYLRQRIAHLRFGPAGPEA